MVNDTKCRKLSSLVGIAAYLVFLIISLILAIVSIDIDWYDLEHYTPDEGACDDRKLVCVRANKPLKNIKITIMVFISLGMITCIAGILFSLILIARIFGRQVWASIESPNLVQFQIGFSMLTSFLWFIALIGFLALNPQRISFHILENVHYDKRFRACSHPLHYAPGFYCLFVEFILSFISMICATFLGSLVIHQTTNPSTKAKTK